MNPLFMALAVAGALPLVEPDTERVDLPPKPKTPADLEEEARRRIQRAADRKRSRQNRRKGR